MKEYLKIVISSVIGGLIAGLIVGMVVGGNNQPLGGGTRFINGLSTDSTAPSAGEVRTTSLTVTAASTLTGTSTVTQSVDGLVVGGTYTVAATGTVVNLYTNSTGPKYCDADTAYVYVKNNDSFAPSLVMSMGTSTGATATTNLIASSTIATTTTTLLQPFESEFILGATDRLNIYLADITNTIASSTYFGNWKIEAGVWCQDISI